MSTLEIKNISLSVAGRTVLKNFSLKINSGEIHAIVGKNGAGKSSLAKAIAGCPGYQIMGGDITIDGTSVVGMLPDEIARRGFFLAFQSPVEIPGVTVANFIRAALQARMPKGVPFNAVNFYSDLYSKMELLQIDKSFSARALNDGFSGGEKKRCEVLQMLMLQPKYVVLDETDSGLDIDALKVVSSAINDMRSGDFSAIIITHHNKLLEYIKPDFVHIMADGEISKSGGTDIIKELEQYGYGFFEKKRD